MKRGNLIVIFLLVFMQLHAQKFSLELNGGTFWDEGYENFMYQRSTYAYTRTYNQAGIGILASVNLHKSINIISGYQFSRRYMEVNLFSNNPVNSFSGSRIYSHSIPFLVEYKYEPKKLPGKYLFVRAGGGVDFNAFEYHTFGMYAEETVLTVKFKYGLFYTVYPPENPIPFLQASLGFGDQLGKYGNISMSLGYKYLLSYYTYEMYYYFDNTADVNPPLEETFSLAQNISEIHLQIAYSFGIKKKQKSNPTLK